MQPGFTCGLFVTLVDDCNVNCSFCPFPGKEGFRDGNKLDFDFYTGYQMPDNIKDYALAIMCGSCMISKKEVLSRLEIFEDNNIAVTNYGVILAFLAGILERCKSVFK